MSIYLLPVALQAWDGWPIERLVYLFLSIAFLAVWIQVTLLHWSGGFRSPYMWSPVIYTPVLVLSALILTFTRAAWAEWLFIAAYALGVVEGLFGAYKHFGGVASHIGGFKLRNFIAGPPAVLPVTYAALALFGLVVYYWDELVPTAVTYANHARFLYP
jgi:hypothetical protein